MFNETLLQLLGLLHIRPYVKNDHPPKLNTKIMCLCYQTVSGNKRNEDLEHS